jgi:hypothetical protein
MLSGRDITESEENSYGWHDFSRLNSHADRVGVPWLVCRLSMTIIIARSTESVSTTRFTGT